MPISEVTSVNFSEHRARVKILWTGQNCLVEHIAESWMSRSGSSSGMVEIKDDRGNAFVPAAYVPKNCSRKTISDNHLKWFTERRESQ